MLIVLFLLLALVSCPGKEPQNKVEVALAPGVAHMDNLAFAVSSQLPCTEISLEARTSKGESQLVWEAKTEENSGQSCPNPWSWGQDLGEGWTVSEAPPTLSPNRLYHLSIKNTDTWSQGFLAFCALQDGSLVSSNTGATTKELMSCIHETLPEAIFPANPSPEERGGTSAKTSQPPGPSPLVAPLHGGAAPWEFDGEEIQEDEAKASGCEEDCEEAEEDTEI
ncbi:MAG: hypothetical protein FWD46_07340 [Cystobacterineae bacterium]|nr:hypothetical protein [Cystobacterineae bacterium]